MTHDPHRDHDDHCGCFDDQDELEHDDDRELYGRDDVGVLRDRCVLGAACIAADPFHGADGCASAEMVEAWERELGGEA